MTRWGVLLLVVFLALGLAPRLPAGRAMRIAAGLTGAVLFAVWLTAW
jgi:hypothetical protein